MLVLYFMLRGWFGRRSKEDSRAPKYDPVAEILALEALGGTVKYDPVSLLSTRAGPQFQEVLESFRQLVKDE
jgi:hypothetical protein